MKERSKVCFSLVKEHWGTSTYLRIKCFLYGIWFAFKILLSLSTSRLVNSIVASNQGQHVRHFWLSWLRWCYWHLMGDALRHPVVYRRAHAKSAWPKMLIVLRLQNHDKYSTLQFYPKVSEHTQVNENIWPHRLVHNSSLMYNSSKLETWTIHWQKNNG